MRVMAAIGLTLAVLVSTYGYTKFADSVRRAPKLIEVDFDKGNWSLQIERTFACVPDIDYETASLIVQLKGIDLFRSDERMVHSEQVQIETIDGIEVGENEIYIEANLATLDDFGFAESQNAGALRVKLLRGQQLIVDEIFWVDPGETSFSQSVVFEVEGDSNSTTHVHGDHNH